MNPITPEQIIFQEISLFADMNELNTSIKEIRIVAVRVYDRLNDLLIPHVAASSQLGIHVDTLHKYREEGLILGIPKNPSARRKRWLYRCVDVLELKLSRSSLQTTMEVNENE